MSLDLISYFDFVLLGLKKKLIALSREKDCEDLAKWTKSLTNHLYWVSISTSEGEDEVRSQHS